MKKIATLLIVVFVSLCIVELLLRVFWHPVFLDDDYKRDDYLWLSKNVDLNSFGYRDDEYSLLKDKDVIRIYTVGDSYVYGWYIDDYKKSFPNILEDLLKEKYADSKIEVVNAAKPGFDFRSSVDRYLNEGQLFAPDVLLVGVNIFDFISHEYAPKYVNNKFVKNLRIYQSTFGNFERKRASNRMLEEIQRTYQDDSEEMRNAQKLFEELSQKSEKSGAEVYLVIFPHLIPGDPNVEYHFDYFNEAVISVAKKAGIKIIDLKEAILSIGDRTNLVLNPTDPHPTSQTNSIVANEIVEQIDFDAIIEAPRVSQEIVITDILKDITLDGFKGLLNTNGGVLYFDTRNGLNTQKMFLSGGNDKQVSFMENILQTAKLGAHDGWPGAKLDYYVLPDNPIQLSKLLYGYELLGVSKVYGYWRENGSQNSEEISQDQLDIQKNDDVIVVVYPNEKEYDFLKLQIDLGIKQFDIRDEVVEKSASSKYVDNLDDEGILSQANYYWNGDKQVFGKPDTGKDHLIPVLLSSEEPIEGVSIIK